MSEQTPTQAIDVVGVYDTDFNQLFPLARPLKASVNDDALFAKHPLEDSTTVVDNIVFNPVEISLPLMISSEQYRSVYQQVRQAYRNHVQINVVTRVNTYENMYIQSMPHEESPDNFNAVVMNLGLYETKVGATGSTYVPLNPADSNTQERGHQETAEVDVGTTFSRWFGGLFQ
jgi:hypothetical protein